MAACEKLPKFHNKQHRTALCSLLAKQSAIYLHILIALLQHYVKLVIARKSIPPGNCFKISRLFSYPRFIYAFVGEWLDQAGGFHIHTSIRCRFL
jgi:hypothetical protein